MIRRSMNLSNPTKVWQMSVRLKKNKNSSCFKIITIYVFKLTILRKRSRKCSYRSQVKISILIKNYQSVRSRNSMLRVSNNLSKLLLLRLSICSISSELDFKPLSKISPFFRIKSSKFNIY